MQKVQKKVSDLLTQTFSTFILLTVLTLIPETPGLNHTPFLKLSLKS